MMILDMIQKTSGNNDNSNIVDLLKEQEIVIEQEMIQTMYYCNRKQNVSLMSFGMR